MFLFKKKKDDGKLKNFFEMINKTQFPGGRKQIDEQTQEIIKLSNNKFDREKAESVLVRGKAMLIINKSNVYNSIRINSGDIIDKDELKTIVAFIMLNSTDEQAIEFVKFGFNTENIGYDNDEIPTGHGEFGYCETNPIPVNGIMANETYLKKLRTPDNKKIRWERTGSAESKVENLLGYIDIYNILDENNNSIGKLYISPYNQKLSNKVPRGFIFGEEEEQKIVI